MKKISTWFENLVDWIDCFDVRVLRWYFKLKTFFKVLLFVPIVIYILLITIFTTVVVFIFDVMCLVVCAVSNVGDHIHRAKVMNQYEERELKIKQEVQDSES